MQTEERAVLYLELDVIMPPVMLPFLRTIKHHGLLSHTIFQALKVVCSGEVHQLAASYTHALYQTTQCVTLMCDSSYTASQKSESTLLFRSLKC